MMFPWKRIWRPFLIPLVFLMALVLLWYRLTILHELRPSPEMRARLQALCQKANVEYPLAAPRIVVRKSQHTLDVYSVNRLVKTYRIALGRDPRGPKTHDGDGKTPEGSYWICEKIPRSIHRRFLGINYPNQFDALRAFQEGRIDLRRREEILQADRMKHRPPSDTSLGGRIGLHGGGRKNDWTEGSIALDDNDIEEIFYLVKLRDPIEIIP